jgi:hypothetical protein
MLDYQNNCEKFKHNNTDAKSFDSLATSLNVQYKFFNGSTELFSDLYFNKSALSVYYLGY